MPPPLKHPSHTPHTHRTHLAHTSHPSHTPPRCGGCTATLTRRACMPGGRGTRSAWAAARATNPLPRSTRNRCRCRHLIYVYTAAAGAYFAHVIYPRTCPRTLPTYFVHVPCPRTLFTYITHVLYPRTLPTYFTHVLCSRTYVPTYLQTY